MLMLLNGYLICTHCFMYPSLVRIQTRYKTKVYFFFAKATFLIFLHSAKYHADKYCSIAYSTWIYSRRS